MAAGAALHAGNERIALVGYPRRPPERTILHIAEGVYVSLKKVYHTAHKTPGLEVGQLAKLAATKGKRTSWIPIVAVVLAVAVVAAVATWYFLLRPTPEKTMAKYVKATIAGDQQAVIACFDSRTRTALQKLGAQQMQMMAPPAGLADLKYTVGKAKINGARAEVPLTISLSQAQAKTAGLSNVTVTYVLVKEDGTWVIDISQTAQAMFRGMGGFGVR